MKLSTRPPLVRLAKIDQEIRTGGFPNASSLARLLEVHPRTILRDLDLLRDQFRAPLAYHPQCFGFFYTDPQFGLPLVKISEGEFIALFLAERLLHQYRNTPFGAALESLFQKLSVLLPGEITFHAQHLKEAYSFQVPQVDALELAQFEVLQKAVTAGQQLEIVYWSAHRDKTRRRAVDPYHMWNAEGQWYLIGYCHFRRKVLMFALQRIREIYTTGTTFDRPADFDIRAYLGGAFQRVRGAGLVRLVRLRFLPEAARYIKERTWHPSQHLQLELDGSLILTVRVNHLLEIKRWAMSFGPLCEVLAPVELRRQVAEELRRTTALYTSRE